jgi:alkylation response protein AidB-like acyl-CoA dehydrogenase
MNNPVEGSMRLGLRLIRRLGGSQWIERLGWRGPIEKLLFRGARSGFVAAGTAARTFKAASRLAQPARLAPAGDSGLFDLTPSPEQEMLRDAVREFARERLRPAASEADRFCAAPDALLGESAALGLGALGVPETLGGSASERGVVSQVLVAETLAHGDMGLAVACLAPAAVSTALALWGDETQQATYLPSFVGEQPPAAALAVLEPRPLFDAWQLQTRARRTAGGFELSGVKALVPRAAQCELFIVAAEIEGAGPALFLVESGGAGLRTESEPAMGLRAAATASLHLDRVQLPANALLAAGDGKTYQEIPALSRLAWCALAVGTGQAALDYLLPYVNERVAFGEPISHRQAVAFAVADIAIELEGMRLLTWRGASRAERGEAFIADAALARRLCADKGVKIGSDAVQLLGGHGFVKEHPVERWYRDLRACAIMEGVLLV